MTLLGLIFFWLASPPSNQWQDAGNWSPNGPPSRNDQALFSGSVQRDIELTMAPTASGLEFNSLQRFRFKVEPLAFFLLNGSVEGRMPEIIVNPAYSGSPGQMEVSPSGSLGGARVILKGMPHGNGSKLTIRGRAGNARIYVNAGSYLLFEDSGDADQSRILAKPGAQGMYGGQIYFYGDSTAENATIILAGKDSALQAQEHNGSLTVGRLSGTGAVFLGANELTLKNGDFSGPINGGTLAFESDSTFTVRIGDGGMIVSGSVILGGTVEIYFTSPPVVGHEYRLFSVSGDKAGDFDFFYFPALPSAPRFKAGFVGNDYTLTILP